jgi:hypothetical protein
VEPEQSQLQSEGLTTPLLTQLFGQVQPQLEVKNLGVGQGVAVLQLQTQVLSGVIMTAPPPIQLLGQAPVIRANKKPY